MPVITVTAGQMSTEQKKELIEKMTQVSMEVTGAPEKFHTVLIQELSDEAMGVGKESVAEIKAKVKK